MTKNGISELQPQQERDDFRDNAGWGVAHGLAAEGVDAL